jgi:hypothetical protein
VPGSVIFNRISGPWFRPNSTNTPQKRARPASPRMWVCSRTGSLIDALGLTTIVLDIDSGVSEEPRCAGGGAYMGILAAPAIIRCSC